jgi:phosphoribosylanthranilate isomerase
MTRIKICGCRSVEQALAAAEAGADFVGLMFAESRRKISREEAADIVRALGTPLRELEQQTPPALYRGEALDLRSWYEHGAAALDRLLERKRPLTVGVFAGNDAEEINEIVDECGIDLIQFSGDEPWGASYLANRQVVKVLHLATGEAADAAIRRIETGGATAVMVDAGSATAFGGTGQPVDWRTVAAMSGSLPLWLAGGLTPQNVAEAIRTARPWAVDVSSGVETDGVKDPEKIRAFVKAAKGA